MLFLYRFFFFLCSLICFSPPWKPSQYCWFITLPETRKRCGRKDCCRALGTWGLIACCFVSDLQPNSSPFLSLCLWRQAPVWRTKREKTESLRESKCETLEQLPVGSEVPRRAEISAELRSGLGSHPQEFNLIWFWGWWDSNDVRSGLSWV